MGVAMHSLPRAFPARLVSQLSGSRNLLAAVTPQVLSGRCFLTTHARATVSIRPLGPSLIPTAWNTRRWKTDYAKQAQELNQQGLDEQETQLEDAIEQEKEKQVRAPWHREGTDQPPVKRPRSAGAMTKGKLLTTPSRLLKLILPLTTLDRNSDRKDIEPLALLVHPQQPLSYLERLIQSELPSIKIDSGAEKVPNVTFRAKQGDDDEIKPRTKTEEEVVAEKKKAQQEDAEEEKKGSSKNELKEELEEDKEDVGKKSSKEMVDENPKDTREDASKKKEKAASLEEIEEKQKEKDTKEKDTKEKDTKEKDTKEKASNDQEEVGESRLGDGGVESYSGAGRESTTEDNDKPFVRWSSSTEIGDFIRDAARAKEFEVEIEGSENAIRVAVPSFNDRTYYLRMRLRKTAKKLKDMAGIKRECDIAAHKGAQRVALGGFGVLAGWWYIVYRLTFETDLGWDTMEPVTYLVGLTTLMGGYLWFLYHNREVSYRSALNLTISRRQTKLYQAKGFDLQRWEALIEEGNALRKEIKSVASEYDVDWDERADEQDKEVTKALKKERDSKKKKSGKNSKSKGDDDDEDDES